MNHCVPDVDVGASELNDLHSLYLPKGEAVAALSDPFCDQGKENYLNGKKQASTCDPDNQVSWMEIEPQEKHAHVFEAGRESALAIDVPLSNSPFPDDEMLSWLQYPLDDTFSKSYCSQQLCETSSTLYPAQSLNVRSDENLSFSRLSSELPKNSDSSMGFQTVISDTAMALGAHRAAGLLPQAGAEAFSGVHVSKKPSHDTSSFQGNDNVQTSQNVVVDNQQGKLNAKNFPFFSQHVAAMKTSLQILGTSTGPSNKERLKQPRHTQSSEKPASVEQSIGVTSLTSLRVHGESDFSEEQCKEAIQEADTVVQQAFTDRMQCGEASVVANVWSAAVGSEVLETGDVTLTSLSDGSDYSTEKIVKGRMVDFSCKRKPSSEEFECDSKDARDGASQEKGRVSNRLNSAKRTRAAEIHNQSERRRRDKINAKMKALQELIPNANKTDKASMLDEAIEYVKMLQAQLQLMSVRTGMTVPPMMMPPGMQYLSSQQQLGSLQMTTGKGVGSGLAMDASSSCVRTMQTPAFLGLPLSSHEHVSHRWYQPSNTPVVMHGVGSSMNLTNGHGVSAFQQFQPLRPPRTVKMYKSNMQEQSNSRGQQ